MAKFGSQNGLVDQGYEDVLECICMMIGHATRMQDYRGGAESVFGRQRLRLPIEGGEVVRESGFTQKLLPDDLKNIHRPMTATAVWIKAQAADSHGFLAQFQTRFVEKKSFFPSRTSSRVPSNEEVENKKMDSFSTVSKPDEMASTREIFEIVEQQSQGKAPLPMTQPTDQKRVVTILDWLSNINHQEMHNFKCSERYQQTGVWISTDAGFQKWRDTSQSSVFWLHGKGETFSGSFCVF